MIFDAKQYAGVCSCGREHKMTTQVAIIEQGCLNRFERIMGQYGISGKRCALYGENSYKATAGRHPSVEQELVLSPEGLHANEVSTAYVLERLEPDVEVIVAIGSGTIHDIARFCAHERRIRFVSCPTGASVDGFCSTVAAMTWHGFKKTLPAVAPEIVIADTEIIRDAPVELVRSGIGDIIAKYIALAEWRMANILTGEYLCKEIFTLTQKAVDTAIAGIPGILRGDIEAYGDVTYALILSGLAMQMMGNSRPASGAEHHVAHLIEMHPEKLDVKFNAMHGEKTGVASIYVAKKYKELGKIEDIHSRVIPFKPLDSNDIAGYYGERLKNAIIKENENDCLSTVAVETLEDKWPDLRKIIENIPDSEKIYEMLHMIGAKTSLEEIGVSEKDLENIFKYSAMVRNRLTLMRIRRMIKPC